VVEAQKVLTGGQGPLKGGPRPWQVAQVFQQQAQVVEVCGDFWVLGAEGGRLLGTVVRRVDR
jgi:hypothetical protein